MMQVFPRLMNRNMLRLDHITMNSTARLASLRAELEAQDRQRDVSYELMVKELKSILIRQKKKTTPKV
jgi:hypothetical protein